MDTDWMKEFDKINIPHTDSYVYENQAKKRIEIANKKFYKYYSESERKSQIKLKFAEEIIVIYFEK